MRELLDTFLLMSFHTREKTMISISTSSFKENSNLALDDSALFQLVTIKTKLVRFAYFENFVSESSSLTRNGQSNNDVYFLG